jgi:nifR3 family TIM-barrel protein
MFSVGKFRIDPPVLLAPMEDVTSSAFRIITKRIANPGLMFTEFVSAMAIHHGARKTLKKLVIDQRERPLAIQIFGAEPDIMAETARLCEEMGADIVDINMGCWVPKVCKTGAGAALLKEPAHAERIVSAVVRAVNLPVTVKVRAGWTYDVFAAPELAKRFEGCGAKMLTLHARFAKQGFDGKADWQLISDVRKAISIPLIGNGDVRDADSALRMLRETGCNGIMAGRIAISNPWALRAIVEGVTGAPLSPSPTLAERIATALEHLRLTIRHESMHGLHRSEEGAESSAVRQLRGQIPLYIKGVYGAAELRGRLVSANTFGEIEAMLRGFEISKQEQLAAS